MHNDLLTIGKFTIHGYGLMIGIGFVLAYLVTEYRARKRGMNTDMVYILFFSSIIFGLLGAKLCYYLTILDQLLKDFSLLLSEGFVVYGGIIGGILAGYVACRIKKQDFWKYFDLVAPAIALAQGFGRIGCLLAGCCYGREDDVGAVYYFPELGFCPQRGGADPHTDLFQPAGFPELCRSVPDRPACEEGQDRGRVLPGVLQHRPVYPGILPGRSGAWERGSA